MIPKNRVVSSEVACSQIPQDGLIASYLLQGTAEDETGVYNGTENGNTYAYTDERGVVGSFNGSSNYITVPTGLITATDVFSIAIWFKTTLSGTIQYMVYNAYDAEYYMSINSSNQVNVGVYATTWSFLTSVNTYNDGEWHLAVFKYDRTNTYLDIDNGAESLSTTGATGDMRQLARHSLIGAGTNGSIIGRWNGSLSNAHFYDRALTATEVTNIYNLEKYQHNNALDNGLIAYYPLDGNSLDNAINQLDGTSTDITYITDADMGVVASLNGSTSKVQLPSLSPFIDANDAKCVVVWFKFEVPADGSSICVFSLSSTVTSNDYFSIIVKDSGLVFVGGREGSSSNQFSDTINWTFDNNWHLLVVQLEAERKVYLDGIPQITTFNNAGTATKASWISYPTYDTSSIAYLGRFRHITPTYSKGLMSKPRFYNRPLSAKEIDWLYDYEKPNSTECIANSTIDNPDPFGDGSGIALYKLDGNANDTTGNYDGTPTSITYADGVFGQSAVFNGSSSKINSNMSMNGFGRFTVTFKLNVTSFTVPGALAGTANGTVSSGWLMYYKTSGLLSVYLYNEANTTYTLSAETQLTTGVDYDIELSWDCTTGTNNAWYSVNGSRVYMSSTATVNTHSSTMIIGAAYTNNYWSHCKIDQFRVFNRALSLDELAKIQNERKV